MTKKFAISLCDDANIALYKFAMVEEILVLYALRCLHLQHNGAIDPSAVGCKTMDEVHVKVREKVWPLLKGVGLLIPHPVNGEPWCEHTEIDTSILRGDGWFGAIDSLGQDLKNVALKLPKNCPENIRLWDDYGLSILMLDLWLSRSVAAKFRAKIQGLEEEMRSELSRVDLTSDESFEFVKFFAGMFKR